MSLQVPILAGVCYTLAIAFFVGAVVALFWPKPRFNPELETQERWREREELDKYFDQMQQWLGDENRPLLELPPEAPRRMSARRWTLEVLRRLGPDSKRSVLQFLHEQDLIKEDATIIFLQDANLSGANLANMHLLNTNLFGVDLTDADLSGARFSDFPKKLVKKGAHFYPFGKPSEVSSLQGANLSGAVLRRTILAGCGLFGANLNGAKLDRTDLRGANLEEALNLTQEQIEQAYGSHGREQEEGMLDTLLPDELEPPAAWRKPLSQQEKEREQSQGDGDS